MISAAYSELLGLIYEASENPAQWQSFLNRFAEVTGARQSLLTISTSQQLYNFAHRYGVSEEEIGEYFQKYGMNDPWASGAVQHPEGVAIASHELWPEDEMERSVISVSFLRPVAGTMALVAFFKNSGKSVGAHHGPVEEQGPVLPPKWRCSRACCPTCAVPPCWAVELARLLAGARRRSSAI